MPLGLAAGFGTTLGLCSQVVCLLQAPSSRPLDGVATSVELAHGKLICLSVSSSSVSLSLSLSLWLTDPPFPLHDYTSLPSDAAGTNRPFFMFSVQGAIHVRSSIFEITGNSAFLFNVAGIDGGEAMALLKDLP